MPLEFKLHLVRQHRGSILRPLAAMNHDLIALKIHILYPQSQPLHQAHPRAVKQLAEQPVFLRHRRQQPPHFLPAQHHWHPLYRPAPGEIAKIRQ
jgi:hypothetical protein